jgi:hypothetical protein
MFLGIYMLKRWGISDSEALLLLLYALEERRRVGAQGRALRHPICLSVSYGLSP